MATPTDNQLPLNWHQIECSPSLLAQIGLDSLQIALPSRDFAFRLVELGDACIQPLRVEIAMD